MPLYEYVCPKGHLSTSLRPLQDRSLPEVCPCGDLASRVMSPTPTTFVFADVSRKGTRK